MKYIFHGTDAKLLDKGLVAGTFFTEDIEVALKYGNTLYVIDADKHPGVFDLTWEDHFVSHCFIPLQYLIVLQKEL